MSPSALVTVMARAPVVRIQGRSQPTTNRRQRRAALEGLLSDLCNSE
jgi:hypothetical protein